MQPYRILFNACKSNVCASKQFLLSFSMALREELKYGGQSLLFPAGMPTTSECIKAIECQDLRKNYYKNVGYVAAKTIDHALKGHAVYIPGKLNQLLRLLSSLIPSMVLTRLIGSRWQKAGARNFRKLVDTI